MGRSWLCQAGHASAAPVLDALAFPVDEGDVGLWIGGVEHSHVMPILGTALGEVGTSAVLREVPIIDTVHVLADGNGAVVVNAHPVQRSCCRRLAGHRPVVVVGHIG